MLSEKNYVKILDYFDHYLLENKTDETNWSYYGLILDWYFNESVLSVEYLNVEDFFDFNGEFTYTEYEPLKDQFIGLSNKKRLKLLENIMNILKHSTMNKEQNTNRIKVVTNFLQRDHVKVLNSEGSYITIVADDIFDYGSYCNIIRVSDGILRKELKSSFQNDEKLKKRMKYEFDNMLKLSDCPQILNVFEFNSEDNSYLMEQGDKNLLQHLNDELEISFDDKLKIVFDVLNGMLYAHENLIIHRDLHLGNILKIGRDFVICDFGLSKDLSMERSMKSSYTEKNNHLFVDPLAISDFRKLDLKSDIYSIGKIIDYIFTFKEMDTDHIFKNIVERCISRNKEVRYESIDQIIYEIDMVLKSQNQEENKHLALNKVLNNHYDSQIHEFIMNLVNLDRISKFIVTHNLSSFGKLIEKFENGYQVKILQSISVGYIEATGYKGWDNYDVFADISYYLCTASQDREVIALSRDILEECARIRFYANNLLERLPEQ